MPILGPASRTRAKAAASARDVAVDRAEDALPYDDPDPIEALLLILALCFLAPARLFPPNLFMLVCRRYLL